MKLCRKRFFNLRNSSFLSTSIRWIRNDQRDSLRELSPSHRLESSINRMRRILPGILIVPSCQLFQSYRPRSRDDRIRQRGPSQGITTYVMKVHREGTFIGVYFGLIRTDTFLRLLSRGNRSSPKECPIAGSIYSPRAINDPWNRATSFTLLIRWDRPPLFLSSVSYRGSQTECCGSIIGRSLRRTIVGSSYGWHA